MLDSPPLQSLEALQRRTMRVLVVAQLLGALGLAAGVTAGALLAEDMTGSPTSAGPPLSVLVLASGIGAAAVAHVMGVGRDAPSVVKPSRPFPRRSWPPSTACPPPT